MANDLVAEGRYLPVPISEWGIMAHWVDASDGGRYLAVRAQCRELGVAPDSQLTKLTGDDLYEEALREFRIQTAGGWQVAKCLRKAEAALWLGTIKPSKVKPELREHLATVRALIIQAADRIVFGDLTGVPTVLPSPARGGDIHVGDCPRCRTPLTLTVRPGEVTLRIAE